MTTVLSRIVWANVRGAVGCGGVWRNGSVRVASTATTGQPGPANVRELYKRRNASGLYYTISPALPRHLSKDRLRRHTHHRPDPLHTREACPRDRASVSDVLEWKFTPQQREVRVLPGETALAFYKAKNCSKEDIIGVATYSVTPGQVAQYFSKIQCFCFEEQKLSAGEEVDMPVFFFIDPDFLDDPQMRGIDTVTLSYTFFKAKYDSKGNLRPTA
ncbi:cytochrome c oxidase assembly protein CtaG/Cox11, domain-containing protein [Tuber brumale]|nr:cytochrome c oxidase assembly protein CtaG/Cox11, domain-containing protein [Tuber brumale]